MARKTSASCALFGAWKYIDGVVAQSRNSVCAVGVGRGAEGDRVDADALVLHRRAGLGHAGVEDARRPCRVAAASPTGPSGVSTRP